MLRGIAVLGSRGDETKNVLLCPQTGSSISTANTCRRSCFESMTSQNPVSCFSTKSWSGSMPSSWQKLGSWVTHRLTRPCCKCSLASCTSHKVYSKAVPLLGKASRQDLSSSCHMLALGARIRTENCRGFSQEEILFFFFFSHEGSNRAAGLWGCTAVHLLK